MQSACVRIDIVTLFPEICEGPLGASMMKRARENGVAEICIHPLRQWAVGKHRITDDTPYGGGQGMVMKPEPMFAAVEALRTPTARVILLSPRGARFHQAMAQNLSKVPHLILLTGHYEGVDQRVIDHLIDEEISIGDYILTNGGLAAAVLTDAIVRLLPGALGDACSAQDESFSHANLEYPHYTRPAEFRGWRVPDQLLSGNHALIEAWRRQQSDLLTSQRRPDLLESSPPKHGPG